MEFFDVLRAASGVPTAAKEGVNWPFVVDDGKCSTPLDILQVADGKLHPFLCCPCLMMANGRLLFEKLS